MNRPYIICHMLTSLDGKVTGDFLYTPTGLAASETYYEVNRLLRGDAFACGRVTMESSFTGGFRPDLTPFADAQVPSGDYIARQHSYYAVSFDRHGNVGWTDAFIHDEDEGYDNCHIIEVLCEDTPKPYLAYLRSIGVSYLFAGASEMDLPLALSKLHDCFGIRKMLLEGGSIINGAFQRENLIDELSLVIAPMTANAEDKPLFWESTMQEFRLVHEKLFHSSGTVHLRLRNAANRYMAACWCPRGSDCDFGMQCREGVYCRLLEVIDVNEHDTAFRFGGDRAQFFRTREEAEHYLQTIRQTNAK
ncbi:MAG: dihydrofolate reductase family protein [Oscillospiraceae bacterium]|nr:dihydrofolate reductase family protein [Oscillospiraceae bacterium]